MPEQGRDDSRAGHSENRSDQRGNADVVAEHLHGEEGGQGKGESHRRGAEPQNRDARFLQLAEFQRQSAFKENDGHEQSHHREKRAGVSVPRRQKVIDPNPGEVAEAEAQREQKQNGGKLKPPGQPLRQNPQSQDPGEKNNGRHKPEGEG